MVRNYDINFISKYLGFKKAWRSDFTDIIKIVTILFKRIFKNSGKHKIIRNYI